MSSTAPPSSCSQLSSETGRWKLNCRAHLCKQSNGAEDQGCSKDDTGAEEPWQIIERKETREHKSVVKTSKVGGGGVTCAMHDGFGAELLIVDIVNRVHDFSEFSLRKRLNKCFDALIRISLVLLPSV